MGIMFRLICLLAAIVQAAFAPETSELMSYGVFQRKLRHGLLKTFGRKGLKAYKNVNVRLGYWRIYKRYGLRKTKAFIYWQERTHKWWIAHPLALRVYKKHSFTYWWRVFGRSAKRDGLSKTWWRKAFYYSKYVAKW